MFLAISQGIGGSLACGYRAPLAALVIAVLARADAGVEFQGSGWDFLESMPFIVAMVALAGVVAIYERGPRRLPFALVAFIAATLGALEFGGLLAAEGEAALPGLPAGAIVATVGLLSVRGFIGGAEERLGGDGSDAGAATALALLADLAALVTAAAALLLSPLALIPLAFSIWILLGQRRRAQGKHEGLRVLR